MYYIMAKLATPFWDLQTPEEFSRSYPIWDGLQISQVDPPITTIGSLELIMTAVQSLYITPEVAQTMYNMKRSAL